MIPRAITRQELAALPVQRYEGEVNVVTKPAEIERAMEDIRAEHVVGFDTETRPAFKKGESYLPCLMQVATARRVHVLQLSRVDYSAAAAELLGSRTVIKAGIGLSYDLGQLERLIPFDAAPQAPARGPRSAKGDLRDRRQSDRDSGEVGRGARRDTAGHEGGN
jgi:hypothetical protein